MVCMKQRPRIARYRPVRRRRSFPGTSRPRPFLLTRNEAAFLQVLSAVADPCYRISCKVRLADIVMCSDRDWSRGHANRIAQKHIDFVVTDAASSRIVAAIELDDRSHQRRERQRRDIFINGLFQQMRVRLIRVPAAWRYDHLTVADFLAQAGLKVNVEIDC